MDEFLAAVALAAVLLFLIGTLDIKRAVKDDDAVYRKVGKRWTKVKL